MGAHQRREIPVTTTNHLIPAADAAERLGCTDKMIRKMAGDGRLPYVKVGSLLRFRPEDLESFIEANFTAAVR